MGMSSFGWGQRQCLGMSITRDETFVSCGGILWGYNMGQKRDAAGKLIEASIHKSNSLLIVKPDPFEMAFEVRSEKRKADIQRLWKESDEKDTRERQDFLKAAAALRAEKAKAAEAAVY